VEALCSRVVVINKGKLVADSPLKALLQKQQSLELIVRFKEPIQHELFAGLGTLSNMHPYGFSLQTQDPDGDRKKIWEIAQASGWNIVTLNEAQNNSLEEIFRTLTQQ
jgi:ABC-2 type transport system ATP-binding protein